MRDSEHQQPRFERDVDVTQRLRHGAQSNPTAALRKIVGSSKQVQFGNRLSKPVQIVLIIGS